MLVAGLPVAAFADGGSFLGDDSGAHENISQE